MITRELLLHICYWLQILVVVMVVVAAVADYRQTTSDKIHPEITEIL